MTKTPEIHYQSTVCIVDADPAVRDSLEVLIDLSNISVRSYSSIRAFWIAHKSFQVQCLLCEAELPDGSGINLYSRLRQDGSQFPFALLLSENQPLIYQRAMKAGIHNIYQKPIINPAELIGFIQR